MINDVSFDFLFRKNIVEFFLFHYETSTSSLKKKSVVDLKTVMSTEYHNYINVFS